MNNIFFMLDSKHAVEILNALNRMRIPFSLYMCTERTAEFFIICLSRSFNAIDNRIQKIDDKHILITLVYIVSPLFYFLFIAFTTFLEL